MTSLLITAPPGSFVSLEKLDDVAQENPDGSVLAIQSKDCEVTNPVADRSVQMWKTFANWARDVRERRLDPTKTVFEIYLNRKRTGKLVGSFAAAKTKESAQVAFDSARSLLWGDEPKFLKRTDVAATLKPHLEEVFEISPRAFRSVIENFQLSYASKTPELDLFELVKSRMAFEADTIVSEVVVDAYGWVKKLVGDQLRERKAPCISSDHFQRCLKASYERLKPGGALPDLGGSGPTSGDIIKLMCENFVRQIDLLKADDDVRNRAVSCLFKARTTRTRWSDSGAALVNEDHVAEFEAGLKQAWRNFKEEVFSDPHRPDEQLRGKLLLSKCELHSCLVEQKSVPQYFIPGCFHELANDLSIGWHPRYKELLEPAST